MKKEKEKDVDVSEEASKPTEAEVIKDPLKEALDEVQVWKNKYAMVFADMDNLRKAQDKSFMEALRYRAEGFIDKLLPALDAFHIALKNPVDDPKLKNYLIGFDYIYKQIQQAMEQEGLKALIVKEGDEFDVKTMGAIEAQEVEGPSNKVISILSQGYKLHDRVVKQALVIVSKAKSLDVNKEENKDGKEAA
jgi:molecular chaperone GrpE